jgi:hypothetical protein
MVDKATAAEQSKREAEGAVAETQRTIDERAGLQDAAYRSMLDAINQRPPAAASGGYNTGSSNLDIYGSSGSGVASQMSAYVSSLADQLTSGTSSLTNPFGLPSWVVPVVVLVVIGGIVYFILVKRR